MCSKEEYLATNDVRQFVEWLSGVVVGKTEINFPHVNGTWATFGEAIQAYAWPNARNNGPAVVEDGRVWNFPQEAKFHLAANSTLQQNDEVLQGLRAGLRNAVGQDSADQAAWVDAIFLWGGVAHGGNNVWLTENQPGLRKILLETHFAISQNDDDLKLPKLRFNSGMTKVYSLLMDDFIIYDSRVAGALAFLVLRWADGQEISDSLMFRCMHAVGNQTRNPDSAIFGYTNNNDYLHAKWNIRANWVLQTALERLSGDAPGLRDVESGLFMMGYDLPVPQNPNLNAA